MRKLLMSCVFSLVLLVALGCAPAPPPLEPLTFSGSETFTSPAFDINTDEWQVNWEFKAIEKQKPNFVLLICPEGGTEAIQMLNGPMFDSAGSTYVYQGKGEYYIKVIVNEKVENIASWHVEVIRQGIDEPAALPATFSGDSDKVTKPFVTKAKKWQVSWAVESTSLTMWQGGIQKITVYPRGETEKSIKTVIVNVGSGSFTIEQPAGEFYFDVRCVAKGWEVKVSEL